MYCSFLLLLEWEMLEAHVTLRQVSRTAAAGQSRRAMMESGRLALFARAELRDVAIPQYGSTDVVEHRQPDHGA
jgi:hypothetical protein